MKKTSRKEMPEPVVFLVCQHRKQLSACAEFAGQTSRFGRD